MLGQLHRYAAEVDARDDVADHTAVLPCTGDRFVVRVRANVDDCIATLAFRSPVKLPIVFVTLGCDCSFMKIGTSLRRFS